VGWWWRHCVEDVLVVRQVSRGGEGWRERGREREREGERLCSESVVSTPRLNRGGDSRSPAQKRGHLRGHVPPEQRWRDASARKGERKMERFGGGLYGLRSVRKGKR
jgi:hypothetical protein